MSNLSERILRRAGRKGVQIAKPKIPSKTLRNALRYQPHPEGPKIFRSVGRLYIPHYWAVMVHDGRDKIETKGNKRLVWYRRGRDPRYPKRARYSDQPRPLDLEKEEFQRLAKEGKIVVRNSTPAVKKRPFFGNAPGEGMASFLFEVRAIAKQEVSKEVKKFTETKPVSVASARL